MWDPLTSTMWGPLEVFVGRDYGMLTQDLLVYFYFLFVVFLRFKPSVYVFLVWDIKRIMVFV